MIAYNKTWLNNLFIQKQATEVYQEGCLTKEELVNIKTTYPVLFYTPNLFIRIGLFILTYIIMSSSFGFFGLMFMNALEGMIKGLIIFFGLVAYAALEFIVRKKNHFRSGVDDALLWISAGMLFGGISYSLDANSVTMCSIAFIIATYLAFRFADRLVTITAFVSLLGIFFFAFTQSGIIGKAIVPFVLMATSGLTYLAAKKLSKNLVPEYYHGCLKVLGITALLALYIAGNYFVVKELGNSMFDLNLQENNNIPFGWLFWIFTVIIPVIYLLYGIQKKDSVFVRIGLLLIAATISTIHFYYSLAPIEVMMVFGGIILILISFTLIRYLKSPRYGFTYQLDNADNSKLQVEALLIAETLGHQQNPPDTTTFGGGSFGGGGASGDF